MIRKLTVLWLVIGVLIALMFLPAATVSVKLDLPPDPSGAAAARPSPEELHTVSSYLIGISYAVMIAIPLAIGAWLTRRIVSRAQARRATGEDHPGS